MLKAIAFPNDKIVILKPPENIQEHLFASVVNHMCYMTRPDIYIYIHIFLFIYLYFLCFLVNIACTKDGIRFSCSGQHGVGNITLRQNTAVDKEEDQVCCLSRLLKIVFAK